MYKTGRPVAINGKTWVHQSSKESLVEDARSRRFSHNGNDSGSCAIWPRTIQPHFDCSEYFCLLNNVVITHHESECWRFRCENKPNSWCSRPERLEDGSRRGCTDWTSNGPVAIAHQINANELTQTIERKMHYLLASIWVNACRSPFCRVRPHRLYRLHSDQPVRVGERNRWTNPSMTFSRLDNVSCQYVLYTPHTHTHSVTDTQRPAEK